MAPEEECEHEMFVLIPWARHQLAVPLLQLGGVKADRNTVRAIGDWHYWIKKGLSLTDAGRCPVTLYEDDFAATSQANPISCVTKRGASRLGDAQSETMKCHVY